MPQPRKLDRPTDVHIVLPETLVGELTVELWSEAHNRIPQGKLSGFIEESIRLLLSIRRGEAKITATNGDSNA